MKLFNNKALPVLFIAVLLTFASACNVNFRAVFLEKGIILPVCKEPGAFIIKTDGTKLTGNKVEMPLFGKIRIDDQQCPNSEIKAYQSDNVYYLKHKGKYLLRILHGKLNLYLDENSSWEKRLFYTQIGEDGELKRISTWPQLLELISDCPKIHKKLDRPYVELKKIIRDNVFYVSQVLMEYNETCGK